MEEEVYVIYGITDCPACLRAQADLMDLGLQYTFIQMDFSKYYRESIKDEFKQPTFPIILMINKNGETLIGGYEELRTHIDPDNAEYEPHLGDSEYCPILKKQ